MRYLWVYLIQLLATLLIIAFLPGNWFKLAALLALWAVTFGRLSRGEAVLAGFGCVFFTAMNIATLQQGSFYFEHPDVLGLPVWEFVMWGFYLLHTTRLIGRPDDTVTVDVSTWVLAGLYCLAFAAIPVAWALLAVTAVLLVLALAIHHTGWDLAYAGYMVVLGGLVEYTGVWSGQWGYPHEGVPWWFITLWAGVGFFLHRLIMPVIHRLVPEPARERGAGEA